MSAPSPSTPPTSYPQSKFRYDNNSSATLTLPDGRKLGYAQYGALTGRPIFYLHGLPGSRMEAAMFDDTASEVGARIIAVERPGHGLSSPQPGRTLLDHPKDIEELAKHLEIEQFSVLGLSGGGPSVLACAFALPASKLKCASLVSALGPPDIGMKGVPLLQYLGLTVGYPYLPSLTGWWFKQQPTGRLDLSDEDRLALLIRESKKGTPHPKDLPIFRDEGFLKLQIVAAKAAFSQGVHHGVHDGTLSCTKWGFRVEDIREDLPMHLWYGKNDQSVPFNHGVQLKKRLGERAMFTVGEDETHASMEFNYMREYLEALVTCT